MAGDEGRILLAQGREAEVFLQADGTVLKLMRNPEFGFLVQREATALDVVRASGHGGPTVHGIVTVDGRPGLVMDRIEGADLLTALGVRPWWVSRTGAVMARTQVAMHECVAPDSVPDLRDELRFRIETAPDLAPESASYALGVLDGLPRGDRLCHGDFHPGNILGPWWQPVVIDWGGVTRGDPDADVARTLLLLRTRGAGAPPGTSMLLRLLIPIGRDLLAYRYLSVYRRLRPLDRGRLDRWRVVSSAARFFEGQFSDDIKREFPELTKVIHRSMKGGVR
ncbi:MAG TPA: phosphotransferase [Acidimicrobiales bacterium]